MSTISQKPKEQRWEKLDPEKVPERCAKDFALGIVEQAVTDWKDMCKKLPKKKLCKEEIEKRKCMFDELRQFFKSKWCDALCGSIIQRKRMIAELEAQYEHSGFLKQAKAFEEGAKAC